MRVFNCLLVIALTTYTFYTIQLVQGQEQSSINLGNQSNETTIAPNTTTTTTTTTTIAPNTTTTTTTTTTTPSTTTTTTTTAPSNTTTTTTTAPSNTTTSTKPPTTTIMPPKYDQQLNFTLKQTTNQTDTICFMATFSVNITFTYLTINKTNETLIMPLQSDDYNYEGTCSDKLDELTLKFTKNKDWMIVFSYTLNESGDKYALSSMMLDYVVDADTFKNVDPSELGMHNASLSNLNEFSTMKDNSYKCFAPTSVKLDDKVTFDFKNYRGEPFISKKEPTYDTAVECSADLDSTSKLVPIIVGSTLALLVVLVLIAYIIGRRKHLSGYQQV